MGFREAFTEFDVGLFWSKQVFSLLGSHRHGLSSRPPVLIGTDCRSGCVCVCVFVWGGALSIIKLFLSLAHPVNCFIF